MLPEIGQLALVLALLLALIQATLPLAATLRGRDEWIAPVRPAALGQALFVAIAFACHAASFLGNDFSVVNVAGNSNSQLPAVYRLAATWGSHEGSLLLWLLLLAGWSVAVARTGTGLPPALQARVLGVLGWIGAAFALFLLATSNPFARLFPPAAEGRDLNPLLQDPAMAVHPPLLYVGYAGFSVAFAFAVAALLGGRMDADWARRARPWTTAAWVFLTLGIAVGSWWAYYELGWGGWWFWDPVENASLMPWLAGTALLHALAVTDRRGALPTWTVLLAVVAFSLSLLGTFLVRSGVLTSVHAFAVDPRRGVAILAFLALAVGAALALFAWRAPRVAAGAVFAPLSRESALLANNVLLLVAMGTVLLGTLYPLALDALGLGRISIGPPYFERVIVPILVPVLLLVGAGPLLRWEQASARALAIRLRAPLALSLAAGALVPALAGGWSVMKAIGFGTGFFAIAATAAGVVERIRSRGGRGGSPAQSRGRAWLGMLLAHAGVGIVAIGITAVKGYESGREVRLTAGGSVAVGGHTFRLTGVESIRGPNYQALRATVEAATDARLVARLHPEKRIYPAQPNPMTEAAIDRSLLRDLYVSLGDAAADGSWSLRVQVKPLVAWIWIGALLMAAGGVVAVSDPRYRAGRRR